MNGWYIQLRQKQDDSRLANVYDRITRTVELLGQFRILSFDAAAIALYRKLESQRLNVGKMDLRIASIAVIQNAVAITSNIRDFSRIPDVRYEDWAQ
ncbi:MAG: hypothetical protein OHK0029_24210 [Armatimonadaceae bacterium]